MYITICFHLSLIVRFQYFGPVNAVTFFTQHFYQQLNAMLEIKFNIPTYFSWSPRLYSDKCHRTSHVNQVHVGSCSIYITLIHGSGALIYVSRRHSLRRLQSFSCLEIGWALVKQDICLCTNIAMLKLRSILLVTALYMDIFECSNQVTDTQGVYLKNH